MNNTYDGTNTVPTTEAGPPSDTTVGGQPPEATEADQHGTGVVQTTVDSGAPAPETRTWQPPMVMEMQQVPLKRKLLLDNLPDELKEYPYCVWKYTQRGTAKPAKVPYTPATGAYAKVSDPGTFGRYDEAVRAFQDGGYDGIGVLLIGRLAAVDIDNCISETGEWSKMAIDIVSTMRSYTEISPSGRGIRIFFVVPESFELDASRYYINRHELGLEVYLSWVTHKYVTATGWAMTQGQGLEVRDQELTTILEQYMARPQPLTSGVTTTSPPSSGQPPASGPPQLTAADQQIIDAIKQSETGERFMAAGCGDLTAFDGDHSSADMYVCNILAAYTADPLQIDRIFRHTQLMRDKWDSPRGDGTYGSMTIVQALAGAGQYREQRRAEQMAEAAAFSGTPVPIQVVDQQNTTAPDPAEAQAAASVAADATSSVQVTQVLTAEQVMAYQKWQQQQALLAKYPICSAEQLYDANLPPVGYLVTGLMPEGVSILVAASKFGKSFLALNLALCLAAGKPFLGRETTQCGVLYLALEDGWSRLQDRMRPMLQGRRPPAGFYLGIYSPTTENGLFDLIDIYLAQHPEIRLVIVDTLQKVRGGAKGREGAYESDYREMGQWKDFYASRGVSILMVHHTNKRQDETDLYNRISGTTGIMGAVDTIWVAAKEKRGENRGTLNVTGRDVEESELIIEFDKTTFVWRYVGTKEETADADARKEYDDSPVVQAVRFLVDDSEKGVWRGQSADIIKQMGAAGATYTSQAIAKEILRFKDRFLAFDAIAYRPSKSSGGCRHCFAVLSDQESEFADAPFADPDEEDDTDTSAPSQPAE